MTTTGLKKAIIYELEHRTSKLIKPLEVCFNPTTYSIAKTREYQSAKSMTDTPQQQPKEVTPQTMSVDLLFDTYETRESVWRKYLKQIDRWTRQVKQPAKDAHFGSISAIGNSLTALVSGAGAFTGGAEGGAWDKYQFFPPIVVFVWGGLRFRGLITSFTHTYTMFLQDGQPVRASAKLSILNTDTNIIFGKANVSPNAANQEDSAHTMKAGETLQSVAARFNMDWRELARLNNIDDPWKVQTNTVLRLK